MFEITKNTFKIVYWTLSGKYLILYQLVCSFRRTNFTEFRVENPSSFPSGSWRVIFKNFSLDIQARLYLLNAAQLLLSILLEIVNVHYKFHVSSSILFDIVFLDSGFTAQISFPTSFINFPYSCGR